MANTTRDLPPLEKAKQLAQVAKMVRELKPTLTLDHVVVVRESATKSIEGDQADLSAFGKMASHTIDRSDVKCLPGAETIKALATDIVRNNPDSQRIREALSAIPMFDLTSSRRNAVAYLIVIEEKGVRVGWLLSVFSAAKASYSSHTDVKGNVQIRLDNAFTQTLVNLIETHQVESLHAGPFHRIVRDSVIGNELYKAVATNGTTLYYDNGMLAHDDTLNWTVQCMVADQQYKGTVKGLSMGVYALMERGCWPKSENQLPALGYKFRDETNPTPVPDETQRELIAVLISWAANPKKSWLDIATMLAEDYGFASDVHRSRQGDEVTILEARHPEIAVKNILASGLPLWLTGTYRYVAGLPRTVKPSELPDGIRSALVKTGKNTYDVVMPIDFHHEELTAPWADPEVIKKAIRRLAGQSPYMKKRLRDNFVEPSEFDAIAGNVEPPKRVATGRAAQTRHNHKPLAGVSEWDQGDDQWALSARDRDNYLLVKRPLTAAYLPNGNRAGWRDKDRDLQAVISPAELHKKLAEVIVEAIENSGVHVSRSLQPKAAKASKKEAVDPAMIETIAAKIADLQRKVERWEAYEVMALEEDQPENLANAMAKLQPLRAELRQQKELLANAQALAQEGREFDTEAHAQFGNLAAALAALAKTEREAPGQLSVILRDMLDGLRFTVSEDKLKVHFSLRVRVATDDGYVYLGPINGTVKNHRRATRVHRRSVMFERMFKHGEDFQTAATASGYGDVIQAKRPVHEYIIQTGLLKTKGLRAAAMDSPIPEVRKILWAEHVARTEGSVFKVPDDIDPAYAAHIRDIYTSDREWALSWMTDNPGRARHAIEMCLAAADPEEGVEWDDLVAGCGTGLNEGGVRYFKEELVRGKGATSDGPKRFRLVYDPVLEAAGSLHRNSKNRKVRARRCPYCDKRTLTHIVRVPEVMGGMLCTECRRSPHTPTVVFPEAYMQRWVGPRGVGMGKNGGPGPGTKLES